METVANNYLHSGDVASAAHLYTSLEHLNPKYNRMARLCRVLADPTSVPLPHRHTDMCEAILSPLIPPEIFLPEDNATSDAVQKKFQRLAVHVHPDKNPSTRAGEAFQRLATLRDEALRLVDQKPKALARSAATGSAAAVPADLDANGKATRGKAKSSGLASTRPRNPPQTREPPVIPNLGELKQTRITLKSLKRRDIDDSFEIFASTNSHCHRRHNADIETDGDEDGDSSEVERQLASTAPSRFVAPKDVRPPPKKQGTAAKGRPPALRQGKAPPPSSIALGPVAEKSTDVCGEARRSSGCTVSPMTTSTADLSRSGSPAGTTGDTLPFESDDDKALIRAQLESMIAGLAQMKVQRTAIRLTCDLSFEAYRREKEGKA